MYHGTASTGVFSFLKLKSSLKDYVLKYDLNYLQIILFYFYFHASGLFREQVVFSPPVSYLLYVYILSRWGGVHGVDRRLLRGSLLRFRSTLGPSHSLGWNPETQAEQQHCQHAPTRSGHANTPLDPPASLILLLFYFILPFSWFLCSLSCFAVCYLSSAAVSQQFSLRGSHSSRGRSIQLNINVVCWRFLGVFWTTGGSNNFYLNITLILTIRGRDTKKRITSCMFRFI